MIKTRTKVFDAYNASEHIKYYTEQGVKDYFIFEYHNQPLDKNGLVSPKGVWKSLKPIKPNAKDLVTKYKYELTYSEKARLSVLNTQIERVEKLTDKLENKRNKLEQDILDEILQDTDYDSIFEGDYWECELSPLGRCIYTNDECGESVCIFCGESEERK